MCFPLGKSELVGGGLGTRNAVCDADPVERRAEDRETAYSQVHRPRLSGRHFSKRELPRSTGLNNANGKLSNVAENARKSQ